MHASEPREGAAILSHHFDDLGQQHDTTNLGMWAFLATEVMFFGGLFAAYAVYRSMNPEAFGAASRHLNVPLGAINTAVLLCSSLTMALAVHAAQHRRTRQVVRFLVATAVLGAGFLGIKAYEWHVDAREGLVPGAGFNWEEAEARRGKHDESAKARPLAGLESNRETAEPQLYPGEEAPSVTPAGKAQLFFVLYFAMTGLHAFHMVVGIILVGLVATLAGRGWFSGGGVSQIEVTGLYWHFIDVVWVFLYPLLYLIEVR